MMIATVILRLTAPSLEVVCLQIHLCYAQAYSLNHECIEHDQS